MDALRATVTLWTARATLSRTEQEACTMLSPVRSTTSCALAAERRVGRMSAVGS